MGEEFQVGVSCGGNWWNLSKDLFGSSPCSPSNDMIMDIKATRSSDDSAGFSPSTIPEDWNQDLHHDSGRSEDNYSNNMSYGGETIDNSNSFKQVNGNYHLQQQHPLNSIDRLSPGYPLNSSSYNNYTSSLLQSLFDDDTYNQPMNISYSYYDEINNSNEFLPILPSTSSSVEQQPTANNHFPFTNNTGFPPSTQSQFLPSSFGTKKRSIPSVHVKKNEEARKLASHVVKKGSNNEPAIKRARLQTPLTNIKVRKEKLGDRVTALQQLVSPFGKTDTASVLHEAIEYIKFLHDQVSVLSTPYMKNGSPLIQDLQAADKVKDEQVQDLNRRGLCLVPISSTFPVTAAETTTDFWTPIFGASFK